MNAAIPQVTITRQQFGWWSHHTLEWTRYDLVGTAAQLVELGVCTEDQFPKLPRRVADGPWPEKQTYGPRGGHWKLTRRRGGTWELCLIQPPQRIANVCEAFLVKGRKTPDLRLVYSRPAPPLFEPPAFRF